MSLAVKASHLDTFRSYYALKFLSLFTPSDWKFFNDTI
jgi:hypothetical protein